MNWWQQFLCRNRRGNVAMIFALSVIPLAMMTGFGVDVWRQNEARSMAQNAVDAAALAAAAGQGETQEELQEQVEAFVRANLPARLRELDYDLVVNYVNEQNVEVGLTSELPALFMFVLGRPTMPVVANAVAARGSNDRIEVALVLDNTWSMSATDSTGQTKIAGLKVAASALVDELMAEESERMNISVVPYADYVNVGVANRNQPWMDVAADYSTTSTPSPRVCTQVPATTTTCTGGVRGTCTRTVDGVPENYSCWTTPQTCVTTQEEPVRLVESCTGGGNPVVTYYRFYGCVLSRNSGNLRLNDSQPNTPYVGRVQTSQTCLNPILPLTSTRATVESAVNGLVVNIGSYRPETYIPGGMVWGINVLSPDAPFTDGRAYGRGTRKILVLMTDGENTLRYNPGNGTHTPPPAPSRAVHLAKTDDDTEALCTYAKSQGIEIYTVGLGVTSTTARDLMRACATSAEHAYNADDSAGLLESFAAIARSINAVRLVS